MHLNEMSRALKTFDDEQRFRLAVACELAYRLLDSRALGGSISGMEYMEEECREAAEGLAGAFSADKLEL